MCTECDSGYVLDSGNNCNECTVAYPNCSNCSNNLCTECDTTYYL